MGSEHDPTLAALEAKVAAWQAVLDAYRHAISIDGPLSEAAPRPASAPKTQTGGFDLPVGALRGQTMPDAIKLYLAAGHRKQTNKDIATGIKKAGFESGAANLEASVASALFRLKKAGIVLRFRDGWDLAEHYPDHIRRKQEAAITKKAAKKKAGETAE